MSSARFLAYSISVCIIFATSTPVVGDDPSPAPVTKNITDITTAEPVTSNVTHITTSEPVKSNITDITTPVPVPANTSVAPTAANDVPISVHKFPDNTATWNVTCIKVRGAIQFIINYQNETNNETAYISTDVPKENTTASGECGGTTQTLNVTWSSHKQNANNSILLTFEQTNGTIVLLRRLDAIITLNLNKNATDLRNYNFSFENLKDLSTPVNSSYKCNAKQTVGKNNFTLNLANLKFEAFLHNETSPWSKEVVCSLDSNNSGGGMSSVGLVFLILFIVVLIVGLAGGVFYYFRRWKSPANAYENM